MRFTVEETNLMCCFDTSSRNALLREIRNAPLNDLDNETAEMLFRVSKKLKDMTDGEFAALQIAPDSLL